MLFVLLFFCDVVIWSHFCPLTIMLQEPMNLWFDPAQHDLAVALCRPAASSSPGPPREGFVEHKLQPQNYTQTKPGLRTLHFGALVVEVVVVKTNISNWIIHVEGRKDRYICQQSELPG